MGQELNTDMVGLCGGHKEAGITKRLSASLQNLFPSSSGLCHIAQHSNDWFSVSKQDYNSVQPRKSTDDFPFCLVGVCISGNH